ncbi:MAG: tetratricopeptide repeat protein [Armatimonadota bacterium]
MRLLADDPRLRRVRFLRGDLASALERVGKRDLARLDALDEAEARRLVLSKTLPALLTDDFLENARQTLASAAETMKDERDVRACTVGLFLIRLHESGVPPEDNPLWNTVFLLSVTEGIQAEDAIASLMEGVTTAEEMKARLMDPAFRERFEAVVGQNPMFALESAKVLQDLVRDALRAVSSGRFAVRLALDEMIHLVHATTKRTRESYAARRAEGPSWEMEVVPAGAVVEAAKRDLTQAVVERVADLAASERKAAAESGDRERAADLCSIEMVVRTIPPADNPVMLALYMQSLVSLVVDAQWARESPAFWLLAEPDKSLRYTLYGNELMADGRPERAERVFRAQTELFPDDYDAHCNLAEALCTLGCPEEAADVLESALARARRKPAGSVPREVLERVERGLTRARNLSQQPPPD